MWTDSDLCFQEAGEFPGLRVRFHLRALILISKKKNKKKVLLAKFCFTKKNPKPLALIVIVKQNQSSFKGKLNKPMVY